MFNKNYNKSSGSTALIVVIVLVLIILGVFYLTNSRGNSLSTNTNTAITDTAGSGETITAPPASQVSPTPTVSAPAPAGTYQAYGSSRLAMAESGDVVLFFRAPWCPTCRALDADIRAHLSEIPSGVTILDVDYDTATALRQQYGVTYQHTLVQVDSSGQQIAKWSGSSTLAALLGNIK